MKRKFSFILLNIDRNYVKTLIKDSFCFSEESFRELRKLVPGDIKVSGFTSPKKVPFQNCVKLSKELCTTKLYLEPNLSRTIIKVWSEKNKKIINDVFNSLMEVGYTANLPDFESPYLDINSLNDSDIITNENNCTYFRPNGKQISNYSDEVVTIAAAILGWFPLSMEYLSNINDGTEEELLADANSASIGNVESKTTLPLNMDEQIESHHVSDSNSEHNEKESVEDSFMSDPDDKSQKVALEIYSEVTSSTQINSSSEDASPNQSLSNDDLVFLEEMLITESNFYAELAQNLATGILPHIEIINERLAKINQHIKSFASSIGYDKEINNNSFPSIKAVYEHERLKIVRNQKDKIIIAELLNNTLAIQHKKTTVLPFITELKELANSYFELLNDSVCNENEWYQLMIAEKHFLNLLIKCIELRNTTDHDEELLDSLLVEFKNVFPHELFNFHSALETQINRNNLFISKGDKPLPDVIADDKSEMKPIIEFDIAVEDNIEVSPEFIDEVHLSHMLSDIVDEDVINKDVTEIIPEALPETPGLTTLKISDLAIPEPIEVKDVSKSTTIRKQPQFEISDHDKSILDLLKYDEPELAYHLAKCYESDEKENLLPSFLLENIILSLNIQSAMGPIAQKMEPNILNYNFIYDKSDKSQFINQLVFASILRPCFFAYDSIGAGLVLQELHSGKMSEFSELKKLIGDFMFQRNDSLSFERINQIKGVEKIHEHKNDFLENLKEWLEKAQTARYRRQPKNFHSILFNNWVKPDGWINAFITSFLSDKKGEQLSNFIDNELNESSWTKRYKKELRTIVGFQKSILDNTEATRWIANNIDDLKILLETGLPLFSDNKKNYSEQDNESTLVFIEKILEEFSRIECLLANVKKDSLFNEIGYLFITKAFRNVEKVLNGDAASEKLMPVNTILNWPLLKLDFYESDSNWQPVEHNQYLSDQITKFIPSLPVDLLSVANKHIKNGNFEALNRLISLNFLDDNKLVSSKNPDSFKDKLISEFNRVRIEIERGCAFGYILNGHRESFIAKIDATGSNSNFSSADLNFPLKKNKIDSILAEILDVKQQKIKDYKSTVLSSVNPEFHDFLINIIDSGNLLVFNDSIERIKNGTFILSEDKRVILDDFYNNFLSKENGHDVARIIEAINSRTTYNGLDFSNITDFQADDAVQLSSIWQSLKRKEITPDDKGFGTLMPFFEMLGFNVTSFENGDRFKKAVYFDLTCSPISGRSKTPLPQYGSFAKGKYRIINFLGKITEEDLVDTIKDLMPTTNRAVIVFCYFWMDQRYRLELAKLNKKYCITSLVLDEALLFYLFSQRDNKFSTFVRLAAPFTFAEPYQTASSNLPEEMFYGRKPQIQKLKDIIGDFSCLIYGGRQLGKTVLQREVERLFNQPSKNYFAIYFDLRNSGLGLWRPIEDFAEVLIESFSHIPGLFPDKRNSNAGLQFLISKIKDWTDINKDGRIILFLDESDKFLEKDSLKEWPHVLPLKGLMEKTEKRFKVVFAGLHDVRRTMKIPNNPLAHFGNPICVGPMLDKEEVIEAQLLISIPIETLGAKFESDDLIFTILSHCNWYPSLIQIFCSKLVNIINEKRQINALPILVSANDVSQAYERSREIIKEKFNLTLSLDERYNLLANIIAFESMNNAALLSEGMSIDSISQSALNYWSEGFDNTNPKVEVKFLLEEMADLGILRFETSGKAALRTPNLLGLIGDERQVKDNLDFKMRTLPSEFNRETSRIIYQKDHRELRSPFPAYYYDKLIELDSKVTIFRGSAMGGINSVIEFLKTRKKDFNLIIPDNFDQDSEELWKSIDKKRVSSKHNLILFDEQKEFFFEDVITILGLLENKTSFSAIFLFSPQNLWHILEKNDNSFQRLENLKVEVFNIPQWKIEVAREWFKETGCITAEIEEIFLKLSNWDKMLNEYHELISDSPENWKESLQSFTKRLHKEAQLMLNDFGLFSNELVAAVKYLIEWDGSLTSEEFINDSSFGKNPQENENLLEYLSCLSIIDNKLVVNSLVKSILKNE